MRAMESEERGPGAGTTRHPRARPPERASASAGLRAFLEAETERLLARHRFGLGGREIARGRADAVDVAVTRACRMVAEELGPAAGRVLSGCAVLAVGGYGRSELAPCSDVDLLFLTPERSTPAMERLVEGVLPLLWDAGLEVGHSVRSVAECRTIGRQDLHARNAMTDARRVTGSAALYERFLREMEERVFGSPRANRFFQRAMAAEIQARRERWGSVIGVQEPNLKEGAGGLRDLHVAGWVARARWGFSGVDALRRAGLVGAVEHARALRAYDFLLRVRNEAHFRTGRRTDRITLDLQPALAESLGYSDQRSASASEIFMRDLYLRAREVHRFCRALLMRAEFAQPEEPVLSFGRGKGRGARAVGPERRYRVRDGRLHADADAPLPDDEPLRLFEVFQVARRHGAAVSDELLDAVRARARIVDRKVRNDPEVGRAFMELLGPPAPVAPALRAMHESGLLGRWLPEFRRVTLLVQNDRYHRYTIDEHTLQTLEALDALATAEDEGSAHLRAALEGVRHPERLALALLLHDVGKGQGGSHVVRGAEVARRVCRRLGLDAEAAEDVVFLVHKHLVMSRVSQRRDLGDAEVVRGFAETVGTPDRLRMLYVLTHADMRGVAPGVWNDWKAALLHELYERTRPLLEGDGAEAAPVPSAAGEAFLDAVVEHLDPEFLRSDVEEFVGHLPDRYRRLVPPALAARHFEMVRGLGSRTLLADWRPSTRGPYSVLSVCVRDRHGLLGALAGALTGAGLDLLSVDVFTRDDGLALDVFRVAEAHGGRRMEPVAPEREADVLRALEEVVSGTRDPSEAVARERSRRRGRSRSRASTPPLVRFVPPDTLGRTAVEVRADDEPGLVYRIATTLASLDLDIALAKIATEKHQALDVFWVTDGSGRPLPDERHAEVERALVAALTEP